MALPVQAVLFLGIIPALIVLYIVLKGYEEYYKEKTIFIMFIVGIIFGVIVAIVRYLINPLPYLIIYIVIFAFFEQLFKTIVLNIGRFQGKKETVIYGLSLGLGFGAAFTPFLIITGTMVSSELTFIFLVGFGSLGFIFFHAATTTYIGYGVYKFKLIKYLTIAILLQIPFNILADATRIYNSAYLTFSNLLLVLYGFLLFYYIVKKIIPKIKIQSRKRSKKVEKEK